MNLWCATFVAMVLITAVLTVLWHTLKRHEAESYNFYSSAFYVFGIFCQSGKEHLTNQSCFSYTKILNKSTPNISLHPTR
jgi:hypothetical protein